MLTVFLQKIKEIDGQLLSLVSESLKNPVFDRVMPIITDFDNWKWILFIGWALLFIFGGPKGRIVCLLLVAAVLIADNASTYILKPFFGRPRPYASSFSFPSNHAINSFTVVVILSWYWKKLAWLFFFGAAAIAYSRVYIGAHYPLDVIAGAGFGILCGFIAVNIGKYFIRRLKAGQREV